MPLSIGNDSDSTSRIHMRAERIASEERCAKQQFVFFQNMQLIFGRSRSMRTGTVVLSAVFSPNALAANKCL